MKLSKKKWKDVTMHIYGQRISSYKLDKAMQF